MRTGSAGVALIQSFESCRLTAYQDQRGIWTIGWGHAGPEVVEGLAWSQAQADAQFVIDLHKTETAVDSSLTITLNQNEFDALVCFTYNVGAGAEAHSTLVRLLNAGNLQAAADQFFVWDHVNGIPNAGLLRRRTAERALFLALG